jgi:hypothetical protein
MKILQEKTYSSSLFPMVLYYACNSSIVMRMTMLIKWISIKLFYTNKIVSVCLSLYPQIIYCLYKTTTTSNNHLSYLSRRWCSFPVSTARMPRTRTDVRCVSLGVDPSFADTALYKLLRTFRSSRCRRRPRCPGQRAAHRAGLETNADTRYNRCSLCGRQMEGPLRENHFAIPVLNCTVLFSNGWKGHQVSGRDRPLINISWRVHSSDWIK